MAITGGFKFFEPNIAQSKKGATALSTSNNSISSFIINANKYTRWVSTGEDKRKSTIEVFLPYPQKVNRLFLINHNFKEFAVTYGEN